MKQLTDHQWALIDALRAGKVLQRQSGDYWEDFPAEQVRALYYIAIHPALTRVKPEPRRVTRYLGPFPGKDADISYGAFSRIDRTDTELAIRIDYYPDEPDRDKRVVATLEDVSVEKGVKP